MPAASSDDSGRPRPRGAYAKGIARRQEILDRAIEVFAARGADRTSLRAIAKDVEVKAVTDAESYADGASPKLSISLTNKGARDCTIDVGSTTQVFTVSSGSDVWWRSTDCQENPSSMIATLTAGSTVVSKEPVVWDRTRSSVETCAQENRQRAPGGGSSYHVGVSIGGFPSATTTQILLF